jgi:hypothetical protein
VDHPRAVTGLSQETLDSGGVAPEALPQYLEGTVPVLRVLRPIDFGGPALAHPLDQAIAGDRAAGKVLIGHVDARN